MSNNIVGRVQIGTDVLEIVDAGPAPVFVDFISEANGGQGIIRIGMVAVTADGDGGPKGHVVQRFRMNLATASNLRDMLTNLLNESTEAREKAN